MEHVYKIVVAGDGGVGKTTFINYYIYKEFKPDTRLTVGVDFYPKTVKIHNKEFKIMLWDLGGQERFRSLHKSFVEGANGAVFMFDLSNLGTLNNIEQWLEIIRTDNQEAPILLVGSKYDLLVDEEDDSNFKLVVDYALEVKEQYNLFDFIVTSSKIGYNIDNTFYVLLEKAESIYRRQAVFKQFDIN